MDAGGSGGWSAAQSSRSSYGRAAARRSSRRAAGEPDELPTPPFPVRQGYSLTPTSPHDDEAPEMVHPVHAEPGEIDTRRYRVATFILAAPFQGMAPGRDLRVPLDHRHAPAAEIEDSQLDPRRAGQRVAQPHRAAGRRRI